MADLEVDGLGPAIEPPSERGARFQRSPRARILLMALIVFVTLLVVFEARALWREYNFLRLEIAAANITAVVGYPGISPTPNYAQPPRELYHRDGDVVLLWANWVDGKGHHWYRAAPGDVDLERLLIPHHLFVARAIDYPKTETAGGTIWRKIPDEVRVIGQVLAGHECVYPVPVLLKVEVINDVVENQPFLVTANIISPPDQAFSIFDATIDGRRVTMSSSGYFDGRSPILYDRGTESLWVEQADSLTAIAGKHKGRQLARIARPIPVAWHAWRLLNPRSRLVTGADRTQALPVE
jgi:hypothetical protein